MLSVDEAYELLLGDAGPLGEERVELGDLSGRILAAPVNAGLTQPPFAASAMDGYAVRHVDAQKSGATLRIVGEAAAGTPYGRAIGPGEAVRIFTGGVVPDGADHIVIQEEAARDEEMLTLTEDQPESRHIRPAGIDFHEGDALAGAGTRLRATHPSLFAAANIREVTVFRRASVALFSNGDELRAPGAALAPGQIINSNHYSLSAMMREWRAVPDYLGCAPDQPDAIAGMFVEGAMADLIVPIGGASVGDRDFVKSAFREAGGEILFEKVAVRPGKPVWYGRLGKARVVGLPGNPASALVTAILFIRPLLKILSGEKRIKAQELRQAILARELPANGGRETYLRAELGRDGKGRDVLIPAGNQDSSLLSPFASAGALIRRPAGASLAAAGHIVEYVPI